MAGEAVTTQQIRKVMVLVIVVLSEYPGKADVGMMTNA